MQDGLGFKNIADLVRKKMCDMFETKELTEKQKKQMRKVCISNNQKHKR